MIENIRQWIEVCDKSGIGIPKEIHQLDAYGRLLESEIIRLRSDLEEARAEVLKCRETIGLQAMEIERLKAKGKLSCPCTRNAPGDCPIHEGL